MGYETVEGLQFPHAGDGRAAERLVAAKTIGLSRLLQFCFTQSAGRNALLAGEDEPDDGPANRPGGAIGQAGQMPGPGAPEWN